MRRGFPAALALVLALTGCSGIADDADTVRVFAAASLTEAFERIGADFEAGHPGLEVTFSFAGSSGLAAQIEQGAPADVFASASPVNMDSVVEAGLASDPITFARNQLVIAVPAGRTSGIESLADLAGPGLRIALCAVEVPCGAAAEIALARAGLELTPATYESDVKATLAKVTLGEVDAALVYRTDARAAAGVEAIEFPESAAAVNDYEAAAITGSGDGAAAFLEYLGSDAALAVLADAGFQMPA